MKQRGFISAALLPYVLGGAAVLGVVLGGGLWIQSSRLATCQKEYATFVANTKAAGEAADRANREREARELADKEKADADHKTAVAKLESDLKRMRDSRPRSSITPKASPTTKRPDLACFDRTLFDTALREFEEALDRFLVETEELVGEGATRTLELDSAKRWAQDRR
jgi:hypothetical protein